jgi:sugar/nucleoside kinase (ribokinase family)
VEPAPRRGFLTAGTWCVDHNKLIDRWPAEDMVEEILEQSLDGGGSACNFAVDIRRLDPDMPVDTIGVVGDDGYGRVLRDIVARHGLGGPGLRVDPTVATNFSDAFAVRSSGRRTHLYHAGASAVLSPDDFNFSATRARILHLGLPGIHARMDAPGRGEANGWVAVLRAAKAAGLETNLEMLQIAPERLRGLVEPCLGLLDTLVVNDFEIGALVGRATVVDGATDVTACRAAAAEVLARGSMRALAVHFPRGAIALGRDGSTAERPSVRVPPAELRSANGAGDAFAAGMLLALHDGADLDAALTLAHASAAASLRAVSTTDGVAPRAACLALADRWGWREAI